MAISSADKQTTMILFESPFRVSPTLKAALEALGDRNAAVCMELTKLHERIERGSLSELIAKFEGVKIKGEVSIVVEGKRREKRSHDDE